jgi:hypothetical protein
LICLANYADEHGICWPSQSTIAKETELSERSATIWLQKLEKQGFITRKRRHRRDGSRTTDYITLQLGKRPDPTEKSQTAESADRRNLTANGDKPNRISAQAKPQQLHPIEPPLEPSEEPPTGAKAHGEALFDELWEAWPVSERPDKRGVAKAAFQRLARADQHCAVQQATTFRALMVRRKQPPFMIPYLKERQFLELVDAPPQDRDGDFIITLDRPEWQAWAEHNGGRLASYMATQGRLICKTRWPEDARQPASQANSHPETPNQSHNRSMPR